MENTIEKLNGVVAVQILRNVSRKWIEARGLEAFVVIDGLRRTHGTQYDNLPSWLSAPVEAASDELVTVSKLALSAILSGEDYEAKGWVEDELEDLQRARAQVLDPITLSIVGATIIGIILASRVKKIGNIEFYEGVPKETVELIKQATTIMVPK